MNNSSKANMLLIGVTDPIKLMPKDKIEQMREEAKEKALKPKFFHGDRFVPEIVGDIQAYQSLTFILTNYTEEKLKKQLTELQDAILMQPFNRMEHIITLMSNYNMYYLVSMVLNYEEKPEKK